MSSSQLIGEHVRLNDSLAPSVKTKQLLKSVTITGAEIGGKVFLL
jgi:hypothetical protein